MITPTEKRIETTAGEIVIRPFKRKERIEIARFMAGKPGDDATPAELVEYNLKLEEKMLDFMVKQGREKIDELEDAEVANIINEGSALTADYIQKN